MDRYIIQSLELHLFFSRIMKEHALFLEAGFTPVDANLAKEAELYKNLFEDILDKVTNLSCGNINRNILNSGEFITQYTLETENKTSQFTGIKINNNITKNEQMLISGNCGRANVNLNYMVQEINKQALKVVNQLINFKERLLRNVIACKIFTVNYPLLIEHILREAKLYRDYIMALENGQDIKSHNMRQVELFWNEIMMEHALFIRGLLDPTEENLITTADDFAKTYKQLLKDVQNSSDVAMLKNRTINETIKYRNFKDAGTKGIESCHIKSVILPLLADHVLREANHYLRLLAES